MYIHVSKREAIAPDFHDDAIASRWDDCKRLRLWLKRNAHLATGCGDKPADMRLVFEAVKQKIREREDEILSFTAYSKDTIEAQCKIAASRDLAERKLRAMFGLSDHAEKQSRLELRFDKFRNEHGQP